ncbi:MAG TPA: hypothetical protein VLK33_19890, partial [Terriglobales bacterium]|nr:hypothetical protein [Terriglobales bacterium]
MRFPSLKYLRQVLSVALLLTYGAAAAKSDAATALLQPSAGQNCTPFPVPTFYLQNTNARALAMGDFNRD